MDKTVQIQTQIRHNAEEISAALSEMQKWEKQMKNRDSNIKVAHAKAARVPRAPIRSGVGTVPVQINDVAISKKSVGKSFSYMYPAHRFIFAHVHFLQKLVRCGRRRRQSRLRKFDTTAERAKLA
jgi:hypothetical protein